MWRAHGRDRARVDGVNTTARTTTLRHVMINSFNSFDRTVRVVMPTSSVGPITHACKVRATVGNWFIVLDPLLAATDDTILCCRYSRQSAGSLIPVASIRLLHAAGAGIERP